MYTAATIVALAGSAFALSSYAPVASIPAYSAPAPSATGSSPVSSAPGAYTPASSAPAGSYTPSSWGSQSSSSIISVIPSVTYGASSSSASPYSTGYVSSASTTYDSFSSQPPSAPYPSNSPPHHGHPGPGGWNPSPGHGWGSAGYCMSYEDSEEAADVFRELIQNYSDELALEYLTEDFVDYSSAVAIIINGGDGEPFDIEKPIFVGRQAFMDAQGSQPEIPFKKLQRFYGCNSVSMRWLTRRSANGQDTETARIPVVGNVIIETVKSNPGDAHNFRIKTIYSEFNSAAWLVNLGVFVPENGTEGDAGNKRSLPVDLRGPMI